jgi:hypothetical protein
MAPSEKVYELLYQPALAGSPWRLVRSLSQGNLTA